MTYLKKIISHFKQRLFYAKLVKKDDLCFDIGANYGKKSKQLLSLGARVIAFEPQSSCFKELFKISKSNFSAIQVAVGGKNGEMDLNLSNYSEVATLSSKFISKYTTEKVFWNKKERVTVNSLDHLIDSFGLPDFCKIDTEGFELEILSNLSYQIPIIEFEFTEEFIEETITIIEVLNQKKEGIFNYTLNEQPVFKLKKWQSSKEIKKTISSLPKNKLHGNLFYKIKNR